MSNVVRPALYSPLAQKSFLPQWADIHRDIGAPCAPWCSLMVHNAGRWCTTWSCTHEVVHNVGLTNPNRHPDGTDSITSTADCMILNYCVPTISPVPYLMARKAVKLKLHKSTQPYGACHVKLRDSKKRKEFNDTCYG